MYFKFSDKAQTAMDKVVKKFKDGNLSEVFQIAQIVRDPADTMPSNKWTWRNQILAYVQTGEIDCRGYRQWQAVERQVTEKGAAYIWAPLKKWIEEDGERIQIVVGFKAIPVFPLSKTEGEPLPEFDYSPKDPPPMLDLCEHLGLAVEWPGPNASQHGSYSLVGEGIELNTHDERTFFHELGHALHDRISEEKLIGAQDPHQETVAEFTACVLSELYGRDITGNSWQYIAGYNKDPMAAISGALDTVQEIMAEIDKVGNSKE